MLSCGTLASTAMDRLSRRTTFFIGAALAALALLLRIWAVDWGLPYVEHPDEPAVLETAVRMVQQGDPNPGIFLYPSLYYYLLTLVIRLHAAWGVAQGFYETLADLPAKTYLFTTAPGLYRWCRTLTALLGSLTVPLLFLLGWRMFDRRIGALAALMLAVNTFHVQHSHYITTDAPTGLWVTLALIGVWGVATDGRWRAYILAGAATGLAAGTKYNAGVVGLALVAATASFLIEARRATPATPLTRLIIIHSVRLLVAGLLALLTFLLTTPFAVLDFPAFRRGMLINAHHYASGSHGDFVGRWRLDGYLSFFWHEGLMPPGALLLAVGLPLVIRRAPRQFAVLGAAVLISVGLLLTQAVNFTRNTLPVVPLLCLLAAAATVYLAEWFGALLARMSGVRGPQIVDIRPNGAPSTAERHRAAVARRVTAVALPLLAALLLIPPIRDTYWLLGYWSRPHTLVAAAEALRSLPRGMLAAVEAHPVQWADDPAVIPVRWLGAHPPDWYRARGYRYLLVNRERYGPEDQAAYTRLFAGTTVILEMPDRSLGLQPGPGGALLDLGEHHEQIPFVRRAARFGEVIELLGYELASGDLRSRITPLEGANAREIPSGAALQINLYWRALAPMAIDYSLFVHVYDAAERRVAQRDLPLRYLDYPTSRWRPGELVIDRADMPLPPLPPGDYRLLVGIYDAATGMTLPAADGMPVVLTTVTITKT